MEGRDGRSDDVGEGDGSAEDGDAGDSAEEVLEVGGQAVPGVLGCWVDGITGVRGRHVIKLPGGENVACGGASGYGRPLRRS